MNLEKQQKKMNDSLEKQTMKSYNKLSEALDTETFTMEVEEGKPSPGIEASETRGVVEDSRGENKVPFKKQRRKKNNYRNKIGELKQVEAQEKKKPRFFCEF